jgi:hypothetical protein
MKTPEFVFQNGGSKEDWIEEHDVLVESKGSNLPSNRIKWWKTNLKIRKALLSINKTIQDDIDKKSVSNVYMISVNNIANLAGVSRTSVTHINRWQWVSKEREVIMRRIQEFRHTIEDLKNEIGEVQTLRNQLSNARKETFVWYNKVLALEQEKIGLEKIINTLKNSIDSKKDSGNSRFLIPN